MIENLIQRTISNIPAPYFNTPNLFLDMPVGTGVFVEDSSGNLIETTIPNVCQFSVTEDSRNKDSEMPGEVGVSSLVIIGRAVEPRMPLIKFDKTYSGYLIDNASGQLINGMFMFSPLPQNRFTAFTNYLGLKIKGYFRVVSRV